MEEEGIHPFHILQSQAENIVCYNVEEANMYANRYKAKLIIQVCTCDKEPEYYASTAMTIREVLAN